MKWIVSFIVACGIFAAGEAFGLTPTPTNTPEGGNIFIQGTITPTNTVAPTATATITNTPTTAPTHGPTPIDMHVPMSFTSMASIKWVAKASTGVVIGVEWGPTACIDAFELYSTDGTTETTITDGASNIIFATKGTLSMTLGTLGPCVSTPVTFTGAPKGSIAWH